MINKVFDAVFIVLIVNFILAVYLRDAILMLSIVGVSQGLLIINLERRLYQREVHDRNSR